MLVNVVAELILTHFGLSGLVEVAGKKKVSAREHFPWAIWSPAVVVVL